MMGWAEYNAWIDYGIEKGWISEPVCDTHNGLPMTEAEIEEWDMGHDPCVPAVRLYGHEFVFEDEPPYDFDEKHPVL